MWNCMLGALGIVIFITLHREWNRLDTIRKTEKQMESIPGEPCGSPKYCCNNPRHSEYFYLSVRLDELKHGKRKYD